MQVDENFNSNAATLAYDDNGNLTDDGVYKFVYDAWNRMVQVKRRPDAQTTIATYAYDAVNRRQSTVVTNCGIENAAGDGGDTTVHFYYSNGGQPPSAGGVPWNIAETRNGSNQTTRQWCWGTQYIDEVLFTDVNGDSSADNDADIDVTAGGESGESPADKRYFYHQDRNWNVVALTEYSPPGSPSNVSGRVAERYAYTPYGEFVVFTGDSGNGEMGARRLRGYIGNAYVHQGLVCNWETGALFNRHRSFSGLLCRFYERDPTIGCASYEYLSGAPTTALDPLGLQTVRPRTTSRERIRIGDPPTRYGPLCRPGTDTWSCLVAAARAAATEDPDHRARLDTGLEPRWINDWHEPDPQLLGWDSERCERLNEEYHAICDDPAGRACRQDDAGFAVDPLAVCQEYKDKMWRNHECGRLRQHYMDYCFGRLYRQPMQEFLQSRSNHWREIHSALDRGQECGTLFFAYGCDSILEMTPEDWRMVSGLYGNLLKTKGRMLETFPQTYRHFPEVAPPNMRFYGYGHPILVH